MSELTDCRVAVLATDGFEESELTEPVKALQDAGAQMTVLSLEAGEIQGVRHDLDKTVRVKVDRTIVQYCFEHALCTSTVRRSSN